MGDSSDSEEFYDAEEFTPVKGSKRSSICKNISVTQCADKDKGQSSKSEEKEPSAAADSGASKVDDTTVVKNVIQGRKRFQDLRRCMQTEEEDDGLGTLETGSDHQGYSQGQPFKIIAHDTMSLQSMTSLGRIGRILGGASESHPNLRDSAVPAQLSREPTVEDASPHIDINNQNVLAMSGISTISAMAEPDVIASTKANSLKSIRSPPVSSTPQPQPPPRPVAPPRRKKRNKLHGSQSLSVADSDTVSVCTTDVGDIGDIGDAADIDDYRPRRADALHGLLQDGGLSAGLASPASTIESLTRDFRDSLQLHHQEYDGPNAPPAHWSGRAARNTLPADRTHCKGEGGVEESGRTHSESRSHGLQVDSRGIYSRRRSAGDEPTNAPSAGAGAHGGSAGASSRPRAPSVCAGALSDREILDQVTVLNLDTGESVPLSVAEHKLPQCMNPLSLHIMRLTSEYIARENDDEHSKISKRSWLYRVQSATQPLLRPGPSAVALWPAPATAPVPHKVETDEECESVCADAEDGKAAARDLRPSAVRRNTQKLKRFFGNTVKKTVDAAKSLAQEVSQARHKEDVSDIPDDVQREPNAGPPPPGPGLKLRASHSHKGPYDFDGAVRHVQEIHEHLGAVWCCKFSACGRLLATAGQDRLLRVWVTRDAYQLFQDMRTTYNASSSSPTPSQESLASFTVPPVAGDSALGPAAPFCPKPFCVYSGHTSDLLDVSWSKNYFLLSSSMDKTVRLWHISRGECLCCFQHIDFVTAIVFHPRDDRYFLSGSLDGKLRLWDIPDKKVAVWNEVDGKTKLITAANFCQNGKFAVVGTYDGRCIFYTTDQLKYHTQIDVRSTRGKNSTGRKISGIEPMPNDDKILVTSNDSRIRLYDLRDLNLSCKYKGYVNVSSQIKASFSHDGKYIVSGSENQCIYIWKTYHDYSKFTSVRRDRNDYWEGIKAHTVVVTCAVFAPRPDQLLRAIKERERASQEHKAEEPEAPPSSAGGLVLVSTDYNGCIKVFVHHAKVKHSSLPASALA